MASPGTIRFVEINAVPAAPPAGSAIIYVKTDNVVYLQDSNGIEVALGTASGITSLTGEATATGPGAAVITLSNSAVIGKVLTGFTSGPNSTVLATDTLIQAIQKLQAQVSAGAGSAITSLTGDVTGTGPGATAATVAFVGGESAADVATSVNDTQDATSSNTASTIVKRDASGDFSANEITADLIGNADTATSSISFTGSLVGDVTGTQGATVVSTVGGKSAAQVSTSVDDTLAATSVNTASTLVKRDASGNFAANEITADLIGNVTGAASDNVLKSGDTITGVLLSSNTTQSTTKDTGSVILEGGLGVEKNINAGGTVLGSNISGSTSGTNTGDVTVTDSDTIDLTVVGQDISADVRISDATLDSDAGGLKVGIVPAAQVSGLATVATTGAYSDLSGTPSSLPPSGTAGGDLSGSYPNPNLSATKQNFLLDRANHTGTQLASTISDFTEAAQDAVGVALTDTATIDLTYDDTLNTISAIVVDSSITDSKLASGIDAAKIADGSVSNTEFQFINSLTSNAQDQLDAKASTTHASTHLPSGSDPLTTAAPLANLSATTTNDAGTAESFSKSDHSHAISTGAASTQTPDQANAAGSSANLAKADHVHNIPSGAVVQIGTSNFAGASASFALADHVHSHGNQTSGALHAAATGAVNGFMSSSDKTKLDASTNLNTASAIVQRDVSGNFSAGTITANLTGNASGSAASFTGNLAGDVSGTQGATVVDFVGGKSEAQIGTSVEATEDATNLASPGAIAKRDASGDFALRDLTARKTLPSVVPLTDGASIATDAALGNVFTVTIAGNRTFAAPTNPIADQKITYKIRQDAVGGRVITWNAAFNFGVDLSGVPNSTSPNIFDYYGFQYNATTSKWDCLAISRGY